MNDHEQDTSVEYDADGMTVDVEVGVIGLNWGGYDYWVYLDLIRSKEDLSDWLIHLGQKTWREVTARRIAQFGNRVSRLKGWEVRT